MAKSKLTGIAGLGVELLGGAVMMIWPDQKWIGYVLLVIGLVLLLWAAWQWLKPRVVDDKRAPQGLRISEAIFHFADREDQKELSNLEIKLRDDNLMSPRRMGGVSPGDQYGELKRRMRREFQNRLRIGDLIATGTVAGSGKRVAIPASHWDFLKMDLSESSAEGDDFQYSKIKVQKR